MTMTTDRMVSGTLRTIMLTKVMRNVIDELMICGTLWEMSCRMVSTSFVYTDMMSPWECVSKYLMGRDSILWNRSTRSLRREPCVTLIIRRL